ncbi:MAG: hypothetical protein K2N79_05735 [Muribaculaceae bacterium]|nr:hypothetical protein [Muribaculaceae bacterium]
MKTTAMIKTICEDLNKRAIKRVSSAECSKPIYIIIAIIHNNEPITVRILSELPAIRSEEVK